MQLEQPSPHLKRSEKRTPGMQKQWPYRLRRLVDYQEQTYMQLEQPSPHLKKSEKRTPGMWKQRTYRRYHLLDDKEPRVLNV